MKCIFKIILLMTVTLCCLNPLSAQEEKTTDYAVKLYYNYQPQPNITSYLTPSLLILKPKASHEFELSRLRFGTSNELNETEDVNGQYLSNRVTYNFALRLKYEYGFKFLTINEKFDFSLHASAEPYFSFLRRNTNSDSGNQNSNAVGGQLHLIPRGTYDISEKWFLDVNFPIEIMDISRVKSYSDGQVYGRSSIRNNFDFFDNILRLRVGLGLRL